MSGYDNPWRDSSPTRRDRDRDFYGSSDPYSSAPAAQMPSEQYHGGYNYDAGHRPVPPVPPLPPYGTNPEPYTPPPQPYGASPYGSTSSFDRPNQGSPRLRDTTSSSIPAAAASSMNARSVYESIWPSTPQNDPSSTRRTRRTPSTSSSSRSRSRTPEGLAFGAGRSSSRDRDTSNGNTADRAVGASPPGKTFVETMTPLASAAATAAGSALNSFFNSPPRDEAAPVQQRPPTNAQSSSIYDYISAAYPLVTGQRPQQPPAVPERFEFMGLSLDKDWIMERLKDTNPWVLLGIVVVSIMIISSIIATLIKLAIFAAIIYLVFVFGIQNGAIASLAAGAGQPDPRGGGTGARRRVDNRPGRRF